MRHTIAGHILQSACIRTIRYRCYRPVIRTDKSICLAGHICGIRPQDIEYLIVVSIICTILINVRGQIRCIAFQLLLHRFCISILQRNSSFRSLLLKLFLIESQHLRKEGSPLCIVTPQCKKTGHFPFILFSNRNQGRPDDILLQSDRRTTVAFLNFRIVFRHKSEEICNRKILSIYDWIKHIALRLCHHPIKYAERCTVTHIISANCKDIPCTRAISPDQCRQFFVLNTKAIHFVLIHKPGHIGLGSTSGHIPWYLKFKILSFLL